MALPLIADVDVRLGWRVLSEGLFLPTNLDRLASSPFGLFTYVDENNTQERGQLTNNPH